jgi:hypothetical protein
MTSQGQPTHHVISGHRSPGRRPSAVRPSNTEGPTSQKPSLPWRLTNHSFSLQDIVVEASYDHASRIRGDCRTILPKRGHRLLSSNRGGRTGDHLVPPISQRQRLESEHHRMATRSIRSRSKRVCPASRRGGRPNLALFENRRSGSRPFARVLCYSDQACGTERTCTGL